MMNNKFKNRNLWNGDLSFIPCALTLGNALCGASAVIFLASIPNGSTIIPTLSIWFIFAAAFFDSIDGYVARKLNAESILGLHLDSLADLISFGMAPAMLVYHFGQQLAWYFPAGSWIAWAVSGFFVLCTTWRLALYNSIALSDTETGGIFSGLPSPAGAMAVCAALLLLNRIDPGTRTQAIVILAYAMCVGFLMVSRFEYLHMKKLIRTGRASVRLALIVLMSLALIRFGVYALFGLLQLYLLSGPLGEVLLKGDDEDETVVFDTLYKL